MKGRGDARRTVAMFRRFAVGQRRRFVGAVLLMAIEAVTAIAVPALIGRLITFLQQGTPLQVLSFRPSASATIPLLAAGIVAVTASNSLVDSLSDVSLAKAGRAVGYHARTQLFSHLQRLSLAFHVRRSTGDVLTRITGDVQALEEFVIDSVKDLVGSIMLLAGTLAFLFSRSWRIALLAVVIVPLLAGVSSYFARRIKASTKTLRAREGDLASTAQEMLTTISVVQTYGRARHEQEKFDQESRSAMDAVLRTARLEALFGFTVSVMEATVIAVVILIGARLVNADAIDAGLLVTFILLIQGMFKPTRRIIKQWNTVAKVYASVERIAELLDREPSVQDAPDARPAPPLTGAVEFRDVSFAYQPQFEDDEDGSPAQLTLQSVSFTLTAGEVVALVGHSGAGKSTIAQLLPRLYDPQAGAVLIDGHDIREFTLDSLRAQISMVLQETVLLRGTVAENIAYGREGATREDVVAAAKSAQAHDFITALPQGYDTVLGERAATLSGGQRQRIAIARAFIRDTPLLVLDEPTTGLDAHASASVTEALQTLLHGRSAVIVSHDLNLIRGVDRILVLSGGRILEEGTPSDLLASGGLYAELYASQFGEAIAEAAPATPAALDTTFETVLLDAVPMPASHREFAELTGWRAARSAPPAPSGADLDALQARALGTALPGLAKAVDTRAMAQHLQRMLRDDWDLESCAPDKAVIGMPSGARLRYRLRLRRHGSGATVERFVGGRLFATREDADDHVSRAMGLAAEAEGREDLDPYEAVVQHVPELGVVMHAFPVDPELPGLLQATDAERMGAILEPELPKPLAGLALDRCSSEVVKYGVAERAVLRYELLWRLHPSQRTVRQVVYGRLRADDSGGQVAPVLRFLRERQGSGAAHPLPFLLPRSLGYLPDLRLGLTEALPGTPQLSTLVRAHVAGEHPAVAGQLSVEGALATFARVVGTLHTPLGHYRAAQGAEQLGAPRTWDGEVRRLRAEIEALARFAPILGAALQDRLDVLALPVAEGPALTPVVAHGDLTLSEVLLDGPISSIFDVDAVCAAEPALDLGRALAHLAVVVGKAAGAGADDTPARALELERVVLREYLNTRPNIDKENLMARVAAYRALALLGDAVRSWAQLKPQRVRLALTLLRDAHLWAERSAWAESTRWTGSAASQRVGRGARWSR
jgi:ABC-type multidrug transport system fused ATPase/permease subunit